jgi:transposase
LAPSTDHDCPFKDKAERLEQELEDVRQKLAAIERRLLGPMSEMMTPMAGEVRKLRPRDPAAAQKQRRDNAAARQKLDTEIVPVPVPADQRSCPACGDGKMKAVGDGTPSVIYEYVAAHFRRRIYHRETLACTCGGHIVTAPCPDKMADRCAYAPSFVAHLIVEKCEDGIPLYRLEKQYARLGIPIARSTMTDLFLRAASLLAPLAHRILARIAQGKIVFADETSIKMLGSDKRAFFWVFLADSLIGFDFSTSRSGDTPLRILGDSTGELVVDLYTGYNKVTAPGRRRRAGCLAHARRKIFAAKDVPGATVALELIRDLYVVEHDAREADCEGTDQHLQMRRERSRPLMARLLAWARQQRRTHPPRSLMGKAVSYLLRNRRALTRFLYVAALPLDNNRSEAALRRVALGRKNYLFVGHEEAGKNIAGLFSLIASCVANEINPVAYLTDVLIRIGSHDHRRIDELLPDRWRPPAAS